MIVKPRKIPLVILQLEALLRRLPLENTQKSVIEKDLALYKKGYRGERNFDYYLSWLPEDSFRLLHGLRIPEENNGFFQIDTLLLTEKYACIFEVKNLSGTAEFNPQLKQLTRKYADIEEGHRDPISQVYLQTYHFSRWLKMQQYSTLPIYSFVIMSHPTTKIQIINNLEETSQIVLHAHAVVEKLHQLEKSSNHRTPILDDSILDNMTSNLMQQHTPLKLNVLKKYHIDVAQLITGVRCPNCGTLPMKRTHGRWFCLHCRHESKEAHWEALQDYALLISEVITNRDLRWFLRVSSRNTALHILRSTACTLIGEKKQATYRIPNDE
ncbi:NERD domain-containing protein [Texcoconibacillus texcoconensis]|uniref:Ribosomal protein L37AE/L43A n=1 Tax=Texcoconibacillus texcoconensis TaxID=1095777 RepID=A0A840QND8_9BACI|nr:ribosomal protein L37AE/L43A [Texcoconibacillus texcoconensis]